MKPPPTISLRCPPERLLTIDALTIGRSLPLIHLGLSCDIAPARRVLLAHADPAQPKLSLTAYLTACLGRALIEHPEAHQILAWNGRLVRFTQVDIGVLVEAQWAGRLLPIIHVVRDAGRRSVPSISAELRQIQESPRQSPALRYAHRLKYVPFTPAWLRRAALRWMQRSPRLLQETAGTAAITAVGGLGLRGCMLPVPTIYNCTMAVGGIEKRAGEERLSLNLAGNHQTIDGAPFTRFSNRLLELIEAVPDELF